MFADASLMPRFLLFEFAAPQWPDSRAVSIARPVPARRFRKNFADPLRLVHMDARLPSPRQANPGYLVPMIQQIDTSGHILIAGPTASGKSALALELAQATGGIIVNADALQVYDCWSVLTARPGADDLDRADHALYGHIAYDAPYSVGGWLADVADLMAAHPDRKLIVTGGTGLYFTALTRGLSPIPVVPAKVRQNIMDDLVAMGIKALAQRLRELDPDTAARTDLQNPARVVRALEVLTATGRGMADWHTQQPPPLLAKGQYAGYVVNPPPDVLRDRIATRFDSMLEGGAMDEVRAMRDRYDPTLPSCQAIGARQLLDHLNGSLTLEQAREDSVIATAQYAKRQRTWLRNRMGGWTPVSG